MRQKLSILIVSLLLLVGMVVPMAVFAVNPVVTITVSAQVVSITNSRPDWAMGTIDVNTIRYFSDSLSTQNDTYSRISNASNVHIDIEIRGTEITDTFNAWTYDTVNGVEKYSLYANSGNATYNIPIKSAAYDDLVVDLGESPATFDWSANFTAPSAFNAGDTGAEKTGSITLVATKHT